MARISTKISWRGGTATCQIWHPVLQKNVRVPLGDASVARENRDKLDRIRFDEKLWYNLPEDTPEFIVTAWTQQREFVRPDQAGEAVAQAKAMFWEAQYHAEVLRRKALEREVASLRGRRFGGSDLPLKAAVTAMMKRLSTGHLDDEYVSDTKYMLNAFSREFGPDTPVGDLSAREQEIREWIEGRRGKDGKPISIGRLKQWRSRIMRLLEESGVPMDRRAFKGWREPERAIAWLTKEQMENHIKDLGGPGNYWSDMFAFQCETGLRPTEIPTIVKACIESDKLTLSPLGALTLKQGSRTIPLSFAAREILKRRLRKSDIAWPAPKGKPWCNQRYFCKAYRAAIEMDVRIGRRTAASLWLRAGMRVEHVAALLGDDPRTVRRRYARILPHEVELPTRP